MILFEPYHFTGKLSVPNRIVMPALVTRLATSEGEITRELMDRYSLYAQGGTGYIVTEAVSIMRQKSGQLLRLNDDTFIRGLAELTLRIHSETEGKIAPQLVHFLRISKSGYRQTVEDLNLEEIEEIPVLFARAAERARRAGFDAVELHFAHAYTMASFLSRHNKRQDAYGGSFENRIRLGEEVVGRTREAVGNDFVIGARINGDEFTLGGNSLEQARVIALRLSSLGLDYLSVSAGGKFEDAVPKEGEPLNPYTGYSGHRTMPPYWMPEKVNVYLASNIRNTLRHAGIDIPVITAGRIPSATVAESILKSEEADLVAIARPTLCDPFWPRKTREGREEEIVRCLYCNRCREADESFQKVLCFQKR